MVRTRSTALGRLNFSSGTCGGRPGLDGAFMTERRRQFASDNNSGICPEAWQALAEANHGHERSYGMISGPHAPRICCGNLRYRLRVFSSLRTAAKSLALSSCVKLHSILCHELSHVDRTIGAPEFFPRTKVLLLTGRTEWTARIDRPVKTGRPAFPNRAWST